MHLEEESAELEKKTGGSEELGPNQVLLAEIQKMVPGLKLNREGKRRLWLDFEGKGLGDMFRTLKGAYSDLHLSTITGLEVEDGIEVIYHFVIKKVLINVKVKTSSKEPRLDTIYHILPVADAYERELHDVLGIEFSGRESTDPLVLPDTWPQGYYPLRKKPKGEDENV